MPNCSFRDSTMVTKRMYFCPSST